MKEMTDPYPIEYYKIESKPWTINLFRSKKKLSDIQESQIQHISNAVLPIGIKNICGNDDRVKQNGTEHPYKIICRLIVIDKSGYEWTGTGFFISPKCIITSGHCVFFNNRWAKRIIVIPGDNGNSNRRPFGYDDSTKFKSVKGWTIHKNRDFDYGAVILKNDSLFKKINSHFETAILSDSQETIYNSGYTDEPNKRFEQWGDFGTVNKISSHRIFYNNDTEKGNSGSPILIKKGNVIKVVGIHSFGNCPNYAVRINSNINKVWNEWKKL